MRITGLNTGEIVLRGSPGDKIGVGDVLVADDVTNGARFFLRVVDVEYGADAPAGYFEHTAGSLAELEEMGRQGQVSDMEHVVYHRIRTVPLGYVSEKESGFHKPRVLPAAFSTVRPPGPADYAFLEPYMGDVRIGNLRSGERVVGVPVGINSADLASHVGIFATTGMGKSNLMKVFAGAIMETGRAGLLLLDPHGEYLTGGKPGLKGLSHHPYAPSRLVVFSSRSNGKAAVKVNSLFFSMEEISVATLRSVYGFSEAQRDALWVLEGRYGKEWMIRLHRDSLDTLEADFSSVKRDTLMVLKRRVDALVQTGLFSFKENQSVTRRIIDALDEGKVVLVDTSAMDEKEELFTSMHLANRVLWHRKRLYQDGKPGRLPVLIIMEEAQRVLGKNTADMSAFGAIAREGRKFGVGVGAVTQQPKLIANDVLSQLNTLFILGLADDEDRRIVKSASKQNISRLENEIQMLDRGEMLITSPSAPFAVPARSYLYEDYLQHVSIPLEEQSGGGFTEDDLGGLPEVLKLVPF